MSESSINSFAGSDDENIFQQTGFGADDRGSNRLTLQIAISATFTAEPMEDAVAVWSEKLKNEINTEFAPYNQVIQQLIDPASVLNSGANDVAVIIIRFEDWLRELGPADADSKAVHLENNMAEFIRQMTQSAAKMNHPLLILLAPSRSDYEPSKGVFDQLGSKLEMSIKKESNIYFVSHEEITSKYPVTDLFDDERNKLGHIPFTGSYFMAMSSMILRTFSAIKRKATKVIVLDCDNTLWGGVCGESQPDDLNINSGFRYLQDFMIGQMNSGKILCLCSKNVEEDVLNVFNNRSEMPLKWDHVVASKINWEPKSANIKALADELSLGLDSFVFIDDNPVECAEVKANCPEVMTVNLPEDPGSITGLLDHLWVFDQTGVTDTDKNRTELYKDNIRRSELQSSSSDMKDFINSLNLEIDIREPNTSELERVAQLTLRTNQFNSTTIRRSLKEIRQGMESGQLDCRICNVKDRFGDYGLVGVMLYETEKDRLILNSMMLSCRVLGRGVEHQMLAEMGKKAVSKGISDVEVDFIPSEKNKPILKFLESQFGEKKRIESHKTVYHGSAEFVAELNFDPAAAEEKSEGSSDPVSKEKVIAESVPFYEDNELLVLLAQTANSVNKLLAVSPQFNVNGAGSSEADPMSGSDIETQIKGIWSDVLGQTITGTDQNFFDAGGTSLKAVEVVSRINKMFKKDLTVVSLFEYPTIKALAGMIEGEDADQARFNEIRAKAGSRRQRMRRRG